MARLCKGELTKVKRRKKKVDLLIQTSAQKHGQAHKNLSEVNARIPVRVESCEHGVHLCTCEQLHKKNKL